MNAYIIFFATLLSQAVFSYSPAVEPSPVLLIPGVGGSVLQLEENNEPIWINLNHFLSSLPDVIIQDFKLPAKPLRDTADADFRQFMLGKYKGEGEIGPVFSSQTVIAPYAFKHGEAPTCTFNKKEGGLCGIEYVVNLPDQQDSSVYDRSVELLTEHASFNNYASLISFLQNKIGLVPGKTLFGFPYDWRQSVRSPNTLARLDNTLKTISQDGTKPVSIISHSMGCIVLKSYINAYPQNANRYIKTWIAIGGPFQGVGGHVISSFFSGYILGDLSVCNCSSRQLAVQSPSLMELLPAEKSVLPQLALSIHAPSIHSTFLGTDAILDLVETAYENHTFSFNHQSTYWPMSKHAKAWAAETRQLLSDSTIPAIRMYAVYGQDLDTPYNGTLTMPNKYQPRDLICSKNGCEENTCTNSTRECEPAFNFVSGDGTVPADSAANPYGLGDFSNLTRHEVKGVSHSNLIKPSSGMFNTYAQWLGFVSESP